MISAWFLFVIGMICLVFNMTKGNIERVFGSLVWVTMGALDLWVLR